MRIQRCCFLSPEYSLYTTAIEMLAISLISIKRYPINKQPIFDCGQWVGIALSFDGGFSIKTSCNFNKGLDLLDRLHTHLAAHADGYRRAGTRQRVE